MTRESSLEEFHDEAIGRPAGAVVPADLPGGVAVVKTPEAARRGE